MTDEKYKNYMRSDEWKAKREERLEVDNYSCAMCGRDLSRCKLQVHHITYKNLGNEQLNDLVTVCGSCHKKLHNYYKRKRVYGK